MAGLTVKVNTVIRAGYNEHSVEKVAERFVGTDVVVRYIESWMLVKPTME